MKTKYQKTEILERVKQANNITKDTDLAAFLGLSRATVSNWYSRNSIDYDLVFSKCEHINLDWLITVKGSMERQERIPQIVAEPSVPYNSRDSVFYELYKEKEEENRVLLKENGRLEERIKQLENNQNEEKSINKNSSISCKPKKDVVGSVSAPLKSAK